MEHGTFNPAHDLSTIGATDLKAVHYNLIEPALMTQAVARGEGVIGQGGTFLVETGKHTGRSPQDKFVVREPSVEDTIWWENNKPMAPEAFEQLRQDMLAHMKGNEYFVQDLYGGADPEHRLNVRVVSELAWHNLFIRHLLRVPAVDEYEGFDAQFTIVNLPSFKADPARYGCRTETVIACDFTRQIVLIAGTSYAGEMKKSVFSMLNYKLPPKKIMPMHCSVNVGKQDDAAIFFGLSGTGKTTLSADPDRQLIGDDEHGWGPNGLFNFEGGCYAKMIKLSPQAEPEIFSTTRRFATVLENVVMDEDMRQLDFNDATLTENTRGAYPVSYIPNASLTGVAGQPNTIIMLTADAFGVLPPIAKLTPSQAMYHFLSGYTAKVAGTEKGVTEPEATFSTCFGAPFMSRHPSEYGNLLRALINEHDVNCWLVNTGWTGGVYGVGHRMPIKETRALLNAALDGSLLSAEMRVDANFGFEVPVSVTGVDDKLLNPRGTWADADAYDKQAKALVSMFIDNFKKFEDHVDPDVRDAAPIQAAAAE